MGSRILVIDNYDSFVYNLVQYLGELGAEPVVHRHDGVTLDEMIDLRPDGLLISPGPGRPEDAGLSNAAIASFAGRGVPVLGVCLGHQTIVAAFGGEIGPAHALVHGKATIVTHDGRGLFSGLPEDFLAGRYHSLAATAIPDCLEISATCDEGEVMAVRHVELPIDGVQFHPESVLTPTGPELARNFLEAS